MRRYLIAVIFLTFISANATAEITQMTVVPTTWKLENYINDNVVAWYTGSPCKNGLITFPVNASSDDKNRFWSVVMTGKVSGEKIFVRYDTIDCKVNSFGISEE